MGRHRWDIRELVTLLKTTHEPASSCRWQAAQAISCQVAASGGCHSSGGLPQLGLGFKG